MGSGGGAGWAITIAVVLAELLHLSEESESGPQPTRTEKPPFVIRHYTSRATLTHIESMGYIMIPDPLSFPGRRGALFFTDTSPIHGGYQRLFIAAALGIDYVNTESFIDIDMNKVGDSARWHDRVTATGITEYYYLTNDPISVASGVVRSGNVSELP